MKKSKKINIIFIICFIIMATVPLLCANRVNNKMSTTENRYLASFPKLFNEQSGGFNRNFLSGFDAWLKDNIGFREFFVKLNAQINYRIFKTSASQLVKVGRDGWFFYNNDNNLDIPSGNYPLTEETLVAIKNEQEAIQKALAKKGIEYVLVLTPSKASIYPEEISGAHFEVRETPIDIVEKYLKENTTIKVISDKDVLLKAKENGQQIYHKTDTHWNEEGAYIGYKHTIEELNHWGLINSTPVQINQVPSTSKGEFSSMMGDNSLLPEESINATQILNSNAVQSKNDDLMNFIRVNQGNDNNIYTADQFYTNSTIDGKKALVYGDSFFAKWKVNELLSQNFPQLTYVWSDSVKDAVVDEVKPDIVIFERTERYITTLAKKADPMLVYGKLNDARAEIVSDNTPKEIERGKKYDINITVKNISNEIWNNGRNIRLCIWQDGQDFGYRINLPDNFELKPNEEYTFTLKDFQAPQGNSTYLEYQMVEEGVSYFGEKKRVDVVVK